MSKQVQFEQMFCSNLMTVPTQAMVARYVSLIPSLPDRVLFSASCDLWSTCDVSKIRLYHLTDNSVH